MERARLPSIDPRRVKAIVFILAGLLVALMAIVDTSRYQSANPDAGTGFELHAIAASAIEGTNLTGGRESAVRTFPGALIVAAVIADYYRRRLGNRRAR